jgi:tetratricopeptide (TPR) repeat protein
MTAVFLIAVCVACAAPQGAARIAVRPWIAAVRAHEPGVIDQPLRDIASMPPEELESVRALVGVVLAEEFHFRDARNDILRRGALLHTDIALLMPARASAWRVQDRPDVIVGRDGEYLDSEHDTAHWAYARALLDAISPRPEADDFVRRWYRAVAARFQNATLLGFAARHLRASEKLFPDDPILLFYAGAMNEALASTLFQNMIRTMPSVGVQGPRFTRPPVFYLREAERLLRRSVARGAPAEARLRLGHVLGQLGWHAEAASTLREVLPQLDDTRARYFAELFLGSEEAALGRAAEARACFKRAAALSPGAQSPLLAWSALERRAGDVQAALDVLHRLETLPVGAEAPDPWWIYFRSYASDADEQLAAVRALVKSGRPQ